MRRSFTRGLALTAVAGMLLAGCGDDQAQDPAETPTSTDTPTGDATDAPAADGAGTEALEDPNEDIEDGVYRGNGVILPVPEGWTLNQQAFAQGIVAAVSEDGSQQMTAQAVQTAEIEAQGQAMDLESLVDGIREQIEQEATIDEDAEVAGADRAHRLTFLDLPARQEGGSESSATIVIAETDELVGEFAYSATTDSYDEEVASLLVEQAGFDPDSEPPAIPQPPQPQQQPAPEGDTEGATTEDTTTDEATQEQETSTEG